MIALRFRRNRTTARSFVSCSKTHGRTLLLVLTAELATLVSIACGGSPSAGGPPIGNPPPTTYTIGGTVSGLTASGLVLQDNGGNNLSVSANGNFAFSGALDSGTAYAVAVLTQPSGQNCAVTNGSGTARGSIWDVGRNCVRQRSRGTKQRYQLDRCLRKSLALRGERLRLDRGVELSQRPVEVRPQITAPKPIPRPDC